MKFVKRVGLSAIAGAALLVAATAANAMMIAPPSLPQRVAQASTIVVGKVEKIEEKTVSAPRFPGDKEKAEYQIAVIKVDDPILAAKGITHVRVGFVPPPMGRPGIGVRPRPTVTFAKDQEVLVFLQPHFEANFLEAPAYFDVINKQGNANFEKDVAEVKKYAKLLADPKAGLTSKDKEDRFTTAAILLTQYRTPKPSAKQPKTEAVDAETSKLILTALAEADWKGMPGFNRLNPLVLFQQLGVTEKDGFNPPMMEVMGRKQVDFQKYPEAAQAWLKENAGKYKIQRFVADEKKDDKKDK
jgi:hypothetical protein